MHTLIMPEATAMYWGWAGPPLGLLYLAAMVPDTNIIDGPLHGDPVFDKGPGVVGITVHSSTRQYAIKLAADAKESGKTVVMGGPHFNAHFTPRQILDTGVADYIIRGSGEYLWRDICTGLQVDPISKFQRIDINSIPTPLPWDKIDVMKYPPRDYGYRRGVDITKTPRINMVTSRGCVGVCEFCTAYMHGVQSHTFEWLEPNVRMLHEIGVRHICFDDDLFGTDMDMASRLCELLGQLGFVWQATTRVDVANEELIRMMSDGGCWQLAIGIESTSDKVLKAMRKKVDVEKVPQIREWTRRYGMNLSLLMMRGYPGQTMLDEMDDNDWVNQIQPDGMGCLGHTLVLPGTQLWYKAVKAGYVAEDYWLGDEPYLKADRNWRL
jgi:anaerobic magnesium-protoporphyrin IX monomethyl ester cyclase